MPAVSGMGNAHRAAERARDARWLVRARGAWHVPRMMLLMALVLVLGLPFDVAAHMVVLPERSEAGGWERYTVLVPTEKPSPTVRVEVKLPTGMDVIAVESKPGWQGSFEPFPIGAARVGWKGGRIPSGEFMSFEFLAWNPQGARVIAWQATQWYEDGSSDKWGGGSDPHHDSSTTLEAPKGAPKGMHRHDTPAAPKKPSAVPPNS